MTETTQVPSQKPAAETGRDRLKRRFNEKLYTMDDGRQITFNQATSVADIDFILKQIEKDAAPAQATTQDNLAASPRNPEMGSIPSKPEPTETDLEGTEAPLFDQSDYQAAQDDLSQELAAAPTELADAEIAPRDEETLAQTIQKQMEEFLGLPPDKREMMQKNLLIEAAIRMAGIPANKAIDARDVRKIDRMVKQIEEGGPNDVLQRVVTIKNLIKGMKRL